MTSPVTYDRRSFNLNGTPFIILSGSVHYIRQHPSQWNNIFNTFKEARLNTVETYVFWGAHDRGTSSPDFTGRNDLFGFISAAAEADLNVILRLGPYVCAEVNYGGFPFRLRDIPGIKFRTFNEPFMREVESWVRLVAKELHGRHLMAGAGGPVILVQLENEYSMVSDAYGDEGTKYLQWCADLQKELDFGVPAIMCYGAAEGVVETINAFYGHEKVPAHRARHGDQPPVWTEAWTGWYDTWGAAHHKRDARDIAYAVVRFFAAGGAGVNYYMWAGGVNYGREGMYLQATSYDYDAPVDEFGQMTTKGKHLGRLHRVLEEVFEKTFHENRDTDPLCKSGVCQWGDAVFVCNDDEKTMMTDVELPSGVYGGPVKPKSVHILDKHGKLLYDTSEIAEEDVITRSRKPVARSSGVWQYCAEPLPGSDDADDGRVSLEADAPIEQLVLTKDTSDYAFYTTTIRGSGQTRLSFDAADVAYVYLDGELVGESGRPWEDRWRNKWNAHTDGEPGVRHDVEADVSGVRELCVMTCAMGLVKGDWQLAGGSGMEAERKGLLGAVRGAEQVGRWRCVAGLAGERAGPGGLAWGDSGAARVPGWFACELSAPRASRSWVLDLGAAGKGLLWVNGVLLGRFWGVCGTRAANGFLDGSPIARAAVGAPTQRFYHVPPWAARGDALRVVLFVERGPAPARPLELLEVV